MDKKILVTIDGSVYSNNSLDYLGSLFSGQEQFSFHLLSCISSSSTLPEAADSRNSLMPENPTHQKNMGTARIRLKKSMDRLVQHVITPDRVTTAVLSGGTNISATIQHEANRLLVDAVTVGRRGIGRVGEMLMGSVSGSLFKRCHSTPLWIIDGDIQPENLLLPLDRTVHSLMAIDHLCHILAGRTDLTIHLFHCRRLFGTAKKNVSEEIYRKWEEKWCGDVDNEDDFLLHGPVRQLIDAGIPRENLNILPRSIDLEESHSIMRTARQLKCGTIVMGRRGVGMAKGLFGGVSDRTLNRVQNMALWIVG